MGRVVVVAGPDFEAARSAADILRSMPSCGLQASSIGSATNLITGVIAKRRAAGAAKVRIVLSYTSNLVSSGLRDIFAMLCRERLVDAIVTTAGGVEEDVIKCLGDTVLGDFALPGAALRREGLNRVGNLLIPNNNYVSFESFYVPLLKKMHAAQLAANWEVLCAPTEHIMFVGEALSSVAEERRRSSVAHCAAVSGIPVFCPALTDGSMGDMIFFYNFSNPGLVVDPLLDVGRLEALTAGSDEVLVVCLGGGLPKHFALREVRCRKSVVLVTTGSEWDGCTSSCCLADDISAGLIGCSDEVVRVQGDATVVFPLMAALAV